ncbi:MAG: hypothetical protein J0M34_09355 [Alphaproteobacteria bacterium]|nr:hypothetical protein [Alphaproteobacteria bacterium]
MKKSILLLTALMVAQPAYALVKVTNLSGAPQTVIFSSAGNDISRVLAPNATEHFRGAEGMLALGDAATIARAKAAKPGAMGELLGDLVAANRTSRIPAADGDIFVVWPDGRLLLQGRKPKGSYSW